MLIIYEVPNYQSLPERIKLHPVSLVLAHDAIESGCGQSRFAIEGNNLFGIISNNKGNSLSVKGKKSFMQKYSTVEESIELYFFIIGTNNAYKKFRANRFYEANVYQMIDELHKYSVKGSDYTEMLKQIIVWNDLKKYDNYTIDSKYIIYKNCLCYLTKHFLKNTNERIKEKEKSHRFSST